MSLFPFKWNSVPVVVDQGRNTAAKGDLQASLRFHAFAPVVLLTARRSFWPLITKVNHQTLFPKWPC